MQNQKVCVGIEELRLSEIFCEYIKSGETEQLSTRSGHNYFIIKKCSLQFSPNVLEYNNIHDVFSVLSKFVRENYDRCRSYNACIEIKHQNSYYVVYVETM